MKKLNVVKILLDIAMVIVFALLFNKMVFHEVAGIVICGAFLLHKLLNWRWIKRVTLGLFGKQMPLRAKLCYVLDVILLLCMAFILVSGIFISKVVFPNLRIGKTFNFEQLHVSVSHLTLLFIGIHVGLHWKWIMDIFKKMVRLPANKVTPWISRLLVLGVFLFGLYSIYTTNYFSKMNIFADRWEGGFEIRSGGNRNFPTDAEFQQNGEFPSNSEFPSDGQFHNNSSNTQDKITGDTQQNNQLQERPAPGQGRGMGKGPGGSRPDGNGPDGNNRGGANALSIIKYIGILSVFSTITYYAERFMIRLRRKKEVM